MKSIFKIYTSSITIALIAILISCNNDDNTSNTTLTTFDRTALLQNIYTNEISVLSSDFIFETFVLDERMQSFVTDTNLANLTAVQDQWKNMLFLWKRLELYDISAAGDSFIHFEINRWPTNVSIIEGFITGSETINESFVAGNGSSSKGISALEYLLFSSDDFATIIATFTTDAFSERRKAYAKALTENLKTKAQQLNTIWINDETTFVNATQNGLDGSINKAHNGLITLIEEIVSNKIGDALGDATDGTIHLEALEAYRSRASLEIIQQNLTTLQRSYTGNFAIGTTENIGYDDYLIFLDRSDLDTEITNAFTNCQEKLNAILNPLYDELQVNPENVNNLKEAFKQLLVYIKIDMASALNTIVTFNDTDGD